MLVPRFRANVHMITTGSVVTGRHRIWCIATGFNFEKVFCSCGRVFGDTTNSRHKDLEDLVRH